MLNLGRYGSREILKLQIFDAVSSTPIMYFDYANTATQEWSADRVYATGAGVRRIAWDGDKEETLTVETQIFTMEHLALLAGEAIKSGSQDIYKSEIRPVMGNEIDGFTVELSRTPIGGNEGVSVYSYINGIITEPQPIDEITGKIITLGNDATVVAGDEVEVYYQYNVTNARKLQFTAQGFPKYVKMVGDTFYSDELTRDIALAQVIYHNAKLQPNFSMAMSSTGDPTSLELTFDLFSAKVDGVDITTEFIIYEDEDE